MSAPEEVAEQQPASSTAPETTACKSLKRKRGAEYEQVNRPTTFACSVCRSVLPKTDFSKKQFLLGTKRKCNSCKGPAIHVAKDKPVSKPEKAPKEEKAEKKSKRQKKE